jgi:hypothetical protein
MVPPNLGCTNQTANNFDSNAGVNDHSCDYDLDDDGILDIDEIDGCIDPIANNYDANATDDDGSCDYDLDDDGVLDVDEVLGCTNSTANNFNSNATDDDGSCDYLENTPCTEDLCWDGSTRNPSDCSCPPEVNNSDTTSDKDQKEQTNYLWIILIALIVMIIVFRLRSKN